MKIKKLIKHIGIVALGQILTGVGIGVFLFSNLGVDPGSVFYSGISNILNVSFGRAAAIVNLAIIIIVYLIDKKYINLASFMAMVLIGYTADITQEFIRSFILVDVGIVVRCMTSLLGCIIMSLGVAIYLKGDLGVSAIDMISELISDKINRPYKVVRIISDIIFVVIGYFMGGTIGVATILAAFLMGPFIDFFKLKFKIQY